MVDTSSPRLAGSDLELIDVVAPLAGAATAMRAHVMSLIEAEIELARRRYPDETAEAVARALHRVSGALLHTPSVRAVELARTGGLDDYRRAMHTLFGIEVS